MSAKDASMKVFRDLVRKEQDRLLSSQKNADRAKRTLSFDPRDYRRRPSVKPAMAISAAIVAAAAVLLMVFGALSPAPTPATVDGKTVRVGEWISASGAGPRHLQFKDGSRVTLHKDGGLRVQSATDDGAHLLLEKGAMSVAVVHRPNTRWSMDVGPYHISVTGTAFDVSWNPLGEVFHLDLRRGSVMVQGPLLAVPRTLTAGETIRAEVSKERLEIVDRANFRTIVQKSDAVAPLPDEPPNAIAEAETAPTRVSPEAPASHAITSRSLLSKRDSDTVQWRALLDAGRFDEAVRVVRKIGVGRVLNRADAQDLLLFGDAARRHGEVDLASRTYHKVLDRFPKTAKAANAAFALGIIEFDRRARYDAAAAWFEASLSIAPGGALCRAASGRLMEARHRLGEMEKAKVAARSYLSQYPDGPHAKLARRILGQ